MAKHLKITLALTSGLLEAIDKEAAHVQNMVGGCERPNRSLAIRRMILAGMHKKGNTAMSKDEGWARNDDKHIKIKATIPIDMLKTIDIKAEELARKDRKGRRTNRSWAVRALISAGLKGRAS